MTVEEYRASLEAMDNAELFGDEWARLVDHAIESELDNYRLILEDEKTEEELFGEDRLAELREAQIDALVEAWEDREGTE